MKTIIHYESIEDGETCIAICEGEKLKTKGRMIDWLQDNDYPACYVIKFTYE